MLSILELQCLYGEDFTRKWAWGGKLFYLLNDSTPYNLNSYGVGFITNDKGEAECYEFTGDDIEFEDDIEDEDDIEENVIEDLDIIVSGTKKWWGETLDKYYPYPYYTDRQPVAFEVVRMIPGVTKGQIITVNTKWPNKDSLMIDDKDMGYVVYKVDYCLKHPEFFKPVYEECSSTSKK